jgi:hypothetical protein
MSNIPLTASITKEAYEQLIALCLKARPIEACGILASSTPPDEDSAAAQTTVDLIIPITKILPMSSPFRQLNGPARFMNCKKTDNPLSAFSILTRRRTPVHRHTTQQAFSRLPD